MCGRYGLVVGPLALADTFGSGDAERRKRLRERLEALDPPLVPRFNAAPTTTGLILVRGEEGSLVPRYARWGLIPRWVKDPSTFRATLFNARSETVHEKPSFRDAFKMTRCIVPVSGFYEWTTSPDGGAKQPYWIHRRDGAPFALAGLYAENQAATPSTSFTVLTTRPAALLASLHDREPVRVAPAIVERWLDPTRSDVASLSDLLEPGDPRDLEAVPVSVRVNRPGVDEATLLEPVGVPLRV
jgi:Uncharacterized conserved protein